MDALLYVGPALKMTELLASAPSAPSHFLFRLAYRPSYSYSAKGLLSSHSEDLPLVLGARQPAWTAFGWGPPSADDVTVSHSMMAAWAAFAKDGRPGDVLGASWPKYSPGKPFCMSLGTAPKARPWARTDVTA